MNSQSIKALTEMEEILFPILREHDAVGLKDDNSLDVLDGAHFMELVRSLLYIFLIYCLLVLTNHLSCSHSFTYERRMINKKLYLSVTSIK